MKVFHGSDSDIIWLQRDFGIYVVGCFDTFHAAKLLRFPILSFAHLLKYYCGISANKKYQLADWRIRPLSKEMIQYAKDDTHYLLYIYDSIRRDLYASQGDSGILSALDASRRTCLKRYEKDKFFPLGYRKLLSSLPLRVNKGSKNETNNSQLTTEQDLAISCLWNWRDLMARNEDESPIYIMSNSELIRIGKAIPNSESAFRACGPVTDFVKSHMMDIITALREQVYETIAVTSSGVDDGSKISSTKQNKLLYKGDSKSSGGLLSRIEGYSTVIEFTPVIVPASFISISNVADSKFSNRADNGIFGSNTQQRVNIDFEIKLCVVLIFDNCVVIHPSSMENKYAK